MQAPATGRHASVRPALPACLPAQRCFMGAAVNGPRAARAAGQNTTRRSWAVASATSDAAVEENPVPAAEPSSSKQVPTSNVWEIDFCSRPLLDERGKKVWELLICDAERNFEYSEYFANSKINSAELKKSLNKVLAQPGAVKPDKVRFFRGQMQTIITKAVTDLEMKAIPSRRCFTIMSWLEERLETVYKQDPRFNDKSSSLFNLDLGAPEGLPDALRGEQWAFVQLPLSGVLDMLKGVDAGNMFGSSFDLKTANVADLPKDMLIPGVAVFSRRALPLAAWTNGLDIAAVKADVDRSCLILETGINSRWRYGAWRASPDSIEEAQGWEDCKEGVKGLHFLAVQPDPDSEELTGMWLMVDRPTPSV